MENERTILSSKGELVGLKPRECVCSHRGAMQLANAGESRSHARLRGDPPRKKPNRVARTHQGSDVQLQLQEAPCDIACHDIQARPRFPNKFRTQLDVLAITMA